jgi:hypothetical protein
VNVERLVTLYPRLYHMAHAGSWPAIRDHGLMTTTQIVDACMPSPDVRTEILGSRRTRSVSLTHPDLGRVVIRDRVVDVPADRGVPVRGDPPSPIGP